ncbi:MAG: hypothetical protein ACKPKO_32990, partial [Candidatus Fonsibacter sp.]
HMLNSLSDLLLSLSRALPSILQASSLTPLSSAPVMDSMRASSLHTLSLQTATVPLLMSPVSTMHGHIVIAVG